MNKPLVCGALCALAGCFPPQESPPSALSNWVRADVRVYRLDAAALGETKGLPIVLSPDEDALHFGYGQGPRPTDNEIRAGIRAQVSAKLASVCAGGEASTAALRAVACEGTALRPSQACIEITAIRDSRAWATGAPPRATDPNGLLPTCPRVVHAEPATADFGAIPVSDPDASSRRWSSAVDIAVVNDSEDMMHLTDQPLWTDDLGVSNYVRDDVDPGTCFECMGANCSPRRIPPQGRCTVRLKGAASFVSSRRMNRDGVVEGSIPFLVTLTDSQDRIRMPTINVGVRYAPLYSTARDTACTTIEVAGRRCAAERILLTAHDGRDQYLGSVSVGDSGAEHRWTIRGGTTFDAPEVTVPAYARPDRPISIFITRCDGQPTDPNAAIMMRRNSDALVDFEPLLRCDP